jgi:hypothetical protein
LALGHYEYDKMWQLMTFFENISYEAPPICMSQGPKISRFVRAHPLNIEMISHPYRRIETKSKAKIFDGSLIQTAFKMVILG